MHNQRQPQRTPKNVLIIVLRYGLSGQSAMPNEFIHIHNVAPLLHMTFELIIQVQSIASAGGSLQLQTLVRAGGAFIGRFLVADGSLAVLI